MTGTRKPHLLALRAGDRRRDLRAVGAVLAVAVAGYLSLGTSCDPPSVEASATVRFAVGPERKRISVWAQGERLWLEFDAEVTLQRDGETVALTREDGQGVTSRARQAGERMGARGWGDP